MRELMEPVRRALKEHIYYSDVDLESAEYKSRDGFSAHAHNCGGVCINEIIPKCEEYDFSYLKFGEYNCAESGCDESECLCDQDGALDAALKIWFKFEGNGEFYIILHGGNDDAPYFRKSQDIYEADFEAHSLDELRRKAAGPIGDLIRLIRRG
jgi:hypothetical protein